MNLTVKDVAEMLNVSEKTIYRMIRNETIPCYRVGGQWRFDRGEIRSWIEDTRQFSVSIAVEDLVEEDEESISVADFLRRGGVYRDVKGGTKEAAIRESLERIKTGVPGLDIKKVFNSVMERENLCSTAIGNGIAVPHPRSFGRFIGLSYIALCFLEKPIPFGALDKEDVDTLFFIFPKSERRFLRIQSKLLRLLKDHEVLRVLRENLSADKLYGIFSRKESDIFGGDSK